MLKNSVKNEELIDITLDIFNSDYVDEYNNLLLKIQNTIIDELNIDQAMEHLYNIESIIICSLKLFLLEKSTYWIECGRKTITSFKKISVPPLLIEILNFYGGLKLMMNGNYSEAIECYNLIENRTILNKNMSNHHFIKLLMSKSYCLEKKGQYKEALTNRLKCLQFISDHTTVESCDVDLQYVVVVCECLICIINCYLVLGNLREAYNYLEYIVFIIEQIE